MGGLSLMHWLVLLVWVGGMGVPIAQILKRTGFHPAWTILAFIPLVNIIALWAFAFKAWPGEALR